MTPRRIVARLGLAGAVCVLAAQGMPAQSPSFVPDGAPIHPAPLREWLTYIASDDLRGRQVGSQGLAAAGDYIAARLKEWGVAPGAADGTYFQTVTLTEGDKRGDTSRNVVGILEGSDPVLKQTYVAFGAHYDHIGVVEPTAADTYDGRDLAVCKGQVRPRPRDGDVINNGADDDGSGTVALMGIARAFAMSARPKRSLVFVWHTAEESGLQGSRYNADHPVVPNDRIVAQLNVDMIGRNRCDDPKEWNSVYLIGSDRISTELHNLSEDANAALPQPLTFDYELNDPADPLALYTRSDHFSYAAKGIPVIFYTTGMHRDYHYVTDETQKIEWEKMARVTRLVYETGRRLADLDRPPARDNKGPRVGKGSGGRLRSDP